MWWLLALPVVLPTRITWEENKALKQNCGVRFMGDPLPYFPAGSPKFLAMGGNQAAINELPFTAAVAMRQRKYPDRFVNCTGVQISPRHIMTAAHCVVVYDHYQLGMDCMAKSPRRLKAIQNCLRKQHCTDVANEIEPIFCSRITIDTSEPQLMMAHVGSTCPPFGSCYPRGTEYNVSAVIVHPDFDFCGPSNDIAIIVLATDIAQTDGIPICMADPDATVATTLKSAGFGFNPFFYSNPWRSGLSVVELIKAGEGEGKIVTRTKEKSLCRGDSGGPLFQSDERGRETLVGIASTVERFCDEKTPVRRNFFIDVRPNLAWICQQTGVCPYRPRGRAAPLLSSEVWKPNVPGEDLRERVGDRFGRFARPQM
ncbi:hypothetical protein Y032_0695g1602 [Ancylostoma ceylanicum]|uniref:Peptidase S1 domain-containing protein n=1 Tax=Ancylostoma ceylanicum TaxID=53326 RepID=A0A016WGP6_9BILA|nr:hypothetical protein Y032_0695g1602 [Ancylostoma ceylanicum]